MTYCENCGYELVGQNQFCENCGFPVPPQVNGSWQTQDRNESMDLKGALIYRMSNGSHELFHSNVIAWMLERDHNFAGVLFPELKGQPYQVFREKKHMDIVLETDSGAYVIENKFKSLPGAYQLERYQSAYDNEKPVKKFVEGVILGVHDVLGDERPPKWHYVDYKDISSYIDSSADNAPCADARSFEHLAVIQYGWLIKQLKEHLEREINWHGDRMPMPNEFASLEGIQLRDLCKKIQTAVFARRLSKQIDEGSIDQDALRYGFRFKITTSFLRGDAILEVRFFKDSRREADQRKDDNWDADCTIGLEIHADKYMWFIKCDEDKVSAEDVIGLLWDEKWFTKDSNRRTVSGRRQKEGLYSFGKEFKYQYLPLVNETDFSFDSLLNKIQTNLSQAKALLPILTQKLK